MEEELMIDRNEGYIPFMGRGFFTYPWFNSTAFWLLFFIALFFTLIICIVCFIVLCCIY